MGGRRGGAGWEAASMCSPRLAAELLGLAALTVESCAAKCGSGASDPREVLLSRARRGLLDAISSASTR
ncbi:hypothetical protein P3T76_003939 [Phytophthora citrophthora]|uniref:Uncharacterized protein n=1 Tax=Phytophthora citrophthora TaxID=4793 RepID=A0AAD9GSS2_9STRA|nr:hypothetical protein P3T76_003939 [Phytophthora citrophthora]